MTSNSMLVVHCGGIRRTREDLRGLPTPLPTATWRPIPHVELVTELISGLEAHGVHVVREAYCTMGKDDARLLGTMDLRIPELDTPDFGMGLGLRAGNDKSCAVQFVAAARVFLCDNWAFSGSRGGGRTPCPNPHHDGGYAHDQHGSCLESNDVDRCHRRLPPGMASATMSPAHQGPGGPAPPCPQPFTTGELPVRVFEHRVRAWRRDGFTLEFWDTDVPTGTGRLTHTLLAYRLSDRGRVIFAGDDFTPPLGVAIDSDECVAACLFRFTLEPDDVEQDYFDGSTPTQRAWLESGRADELSALVGQLENDLC
jgi:hypothetical protein